MIDIRHLFDSISCGTNACAAVLVQPRIASGRRHKQRPHPEQTPSGRDLALFSAVFCALFIDVHPGLPDRIAYSLRALIGLLANHDVLDFGSRLANDRVVVTLY